MSIWKRNPEHTRGYAACDKCKGKEQKGSITYTDGNTTLCHKHYVEKLILFRIRDDAAYPITSVCKEDIKALFYKSNKKAMTAIDRMTDEDMKNLAEDMADDYCEQLFSESLRNIFETKYMRRKK